MIVIAAADVRAVLGPYGRAWTDEQIEASAVMVPARRELLTLCPSADEIVDLEEMEAAMVALASLVAANLIMSMPQFSSSRLGGSSVTFATNSQTTRAEELRTQAAELMAGVCPGASGRPRLATLFRVVPGGRGA